MKFSYNWLQDYFLEKLPAPIILGKKIGLNSFEFEGIEEIKINNKTDFLIDWDILPNRSSDCLCYIGMAKEIGAVLNLETKMFFTKNLLEKKFSNQIKTSDYINLKIKNKNLIKKALKRFATDVKVRESPQWLKNYLESVGQKSINNVVDITNYVMLTTGQPVHAFDYDKLSGKKNKKKIKITFAKKGEKIVDLTGIEHQLDEEILVIVDEEKNLDIAGIKGGNVSAVDQKTTQLMLSAVNFDFENIRNTSKKLKLQTDASKRFENGVPLGKTIWAMAQMSYLLEEIAGAKISNEVLDTNPNYEKKSKIICSIKKINSLLGSNISPKEIGDILYRLKLKNKNHLKNDIFEIDFNENRPDLILWQDIAEEVGRIYGYKNIKEKFPEEEFHLPKKNEVKEAINKISDFLVNQGFYEVYNRSLVEKGQIKLKNSLNAKIGALRNNLLNELFKKVEKNLIHSDEPKIFEIGKIFVDYKNSKKDRVVNEFFSFAGVIGKRKIKEKEKENLFFKTKGYLEKIFEIISIENIIWKNSDDQDFVAEFFHKKEKIGMVGINYWEINLEKLINIKAKKVSYRKVSKYPKIDRDISFYVPVDFSVQKAKELIKNILPSEVIELKLFDIYEDKENNKKSFGFRIIMQSDKKTLSDHFANEVMEKILKILRKNNFEIR